MGVRRPLATQMKDITCQTYSDSDGEYRVLDIIDWAQNNAPLMTLSVDKLAQLAFEPSPYESGDELPGSHEFVERAMNSDLSYPIVVIRYPDGDFIADGNHRLWKAQELGLRSIQGYLMHEDDLGNIPNKSDEIKRDFDV